MARVPERHELAVPMMFRRFILCGAGLGILTAIALLVFYTVSGRTAGLEMVIAWPASLALISLENEPARSLSSWLTVVIAVLLNAVWYAALASAALAIYRLFATHGEA